MNKSITNTHSKLQRFTQLSALCLIICELTVIVGAVVTKQLIPGTRSALEQSIGKIAMLAYSGVLLFTFTSILFIVILTFRILSSGEKFGVKAGWLTAFGLLFWLPALIATLYFGP